MSPEFIRSPLWKNDAAVRIMIIIEARIASAGQVEIGGHGRFGLEPGECLVGRADLAYACLTTEAKVRTALDNLRDAGWILFRTTPHGTAVRLVDRGPNYPETYITPRERRI